MATTDWKIAKSNHCCTLCDKKLVEGEHYFSVLVEKGASFERLNYCEGCFREHHPEQVFSFWKTAVPVEDEDAERKPVLDLDSVFDFFRRLAPEREPQRMAFRYVLALMLTRKRVLKLEGSKRAKDGAEFLVFAERRGGERHEVFQPKLDESEITAVSAELGRLLGLTPPPDAAPDAEAAEGSEGAPVETEAREVSE